MRKIENRVIVDRKKLRAQLILAGLTLRHDLADHPRLGNPSEETVKDWNRRGWPPEAFSSLVDILGIETKEILEKLLI